MVTNRSEMCHKDMEGFKAFIQSFGWELVPFEHPFEVLRAKKGKLVMLVYKAVRNVYYTVTQESLLAWDEYKIATNWVKTPYEELK